jgi:hypothetical protein
MSYQNPQTHGDESTMHDYYGLFIMDLATRVHQRGLYGLDMSTVQAELALYNCTIDGQHLVFDNDRDSTRFLLRWSR